MTRGVAMDVAPAFFRLACRSSNSFFAASLKRGSGPNEGRPAGGPPSGGAGPAPGGGGPAPGGGGPAPGGRGPAPGGGGPPPGGGGGAPGIGARSRHTPVKSFGSFVGAYPGIGGGGFQPSSGRTGEPLLCG